MFCLLNPHENIFLFDSFFGQVPKHTQLKTSYSKGILLKQNDNLYINESPNVTIEF